jgi:hypothetical protein
MGPFSILEVVGVNALKLDLPAEFRIHPVFMCLNSNHMYRPLSLVRNLQALVLCLHADKEITILITIYEVETILGKKKFACSWRFLVKWKGWSDHANSWETLRKVRHLTLSPLR